MPLIGTSTSASAKGYGMLASGSIDVDPSFNNVSALLHGDGTNGAQNNTFIDSSTNALAVTRSGSATQGTFTPFSQTGWSNYFNGSTDYLSVGTSLFNYTTANSSTQTATIEAFVYITAYGSPSQPYHNECIISKGDVYMNFGINSSGNLVLQHYDGSQRIVTSTGTIPLNTWTYVACTISGGVVTLYINGSSSGTGTWFGIASAGQNSVSQIARASTNASSIYFSGYISNIRVSTNVRTIATPTVAYSSDANTALLTCQSNRIVDNSGNAIALTITGTPSTQAFSPFAPTAVYDTTVVGGSAYFDGSSYLNIPNNSSNNFASGTPCTIEFWVNSTAYPTGSNEATIISNWSSTTTGWRIGIYNSNIYFYTNGEKFATPISLNSWTHIAVTHDGTNTSLYKNGSLIGSNATTTWNQASKAIYIGANDQSVNIFYFTGYISSLRIVKGLAVYTGAFTPPTSPVTTTSNGGAVGNNTPPTSAQTSLLLNFTNAGIFDNAAKNNLITAGSAQVSSAQVKFGTGSMYFDATAGTYLSFPKNAQYQFNASNFTIEGWLYSKTVGTSQRCILDFRNSQSSTAGILFREQDGGYLVYIGGNAISTTTGRIANAWQHFAIVRNSSTITLFLDGTAVAPTYNIGVNSLSDSSLLIGAFVDSSALGNVYNGHIDDLRITKGIARYTANFNPPTQAFPNR